MTLGVLQVMSVVVALTLTLTMSPSVDALAGGEYAKPGEFPHAVQLSSSKTGQFFCGGSIFSPNVVITAAHCVYWKGDIKSAMPPELMYLKEYTVVTAGLENWGGIGSKESGYEMIQTRTVNLYVFHPYFNISSLENDIALLIFDEPLNYTDKVKPIQLPLPNATYSRGTLFGWGRTDGRNLSSPYLKKMEVVFEDRESCNSDPLMVMMKPKGRKVTDLELCTKWRKGSSSCKRDQGSSVICQGSNATFHNNGTSNSSLSPTICGIVTFGTVDGLSGESDKIGVFVDVSKYLDWIQKEAERGVEELQEMHRMARIEFLIMFVIICISIVVLLVICSCEIYNKYHKSYDLV